MTQPTLPSPTVIPAQPAQLRLGERTVAVPSQPLSRESRKRRDVELYSDGPNGLVLKTTPGSVRKRWLMGWLFALLMAGAAGFIWVLCLPDLMQGEWWAVALVLASLPFLGIFALVVVGLLIGKGPLRFRFDLRDRQLVIDRSYGSGRKYETESTRSLNEVGAVQLLYSGYHSVSHTTDASSWSDQFFTYEMNLVFGDGSRLHLCTHADWSWMRQEGQRLADFLEVPVIDQLYHGA